MNPKSNPVLLLGAHNATGSAFIRELLFFRQKRLK
jgi:hypothetical protein